MKRRQIRNTAICLLALLLLCGCTFEKDIPKASPQPAESQPAEPAATPEPTATPAPTPTPVPTATPAPTATSVPTATPAPAATPEPTADLGEDIPFSIGGDIELPKVP